MTRAHGIVADGREREKAAQIDGIRERVERAHAEEMRHAGWFRRMFIRWRVRREMQRELEGVAPLDALYNRTEIKFDSSKKHRSPTDPS